MKVNFLNTNRNSNIPVSFRAGITNIYSDFDGTFMPDEFKHDSIVKNEPPLDRKSFEMYFQAFDRLLNIIRGEQGDSKLNFSIITGRNIHEYNYILKNIKKQNMYVPLADRLISSNGADVYIRNGEVDEFYHQSLDAPYSMDVFDSEKKEWIRKNANGWDGKKIKDAIKQYLQNAIIIPRNFKREELFKKITSDYTDTQKKEWYDSLLNFSGDKNALFEYIKESSQKYLNTLSQTEKEQCEKDLWDISSEFYDAKNGKYKFKILDSKTNQCGWSYPNTRITLQHQLEQLPKEDRYYVSFREDGDLNFHIAFPWVKEVQDLKDYDLLEPEFVIGASCDEGLKNLLDGNNSSFVNLSAQAKVDDEAYNAQGQRTSAFRLRPMLNLEGGFLNNGGELDKMHDVQRKAQEIVKNGSDDLIITAGDGSNDLKMLNLTSYMSVDEMNWSNRKAVKELKKLPIISIFIKNKDIKGFDPYEAEKIYNADGVLRFIVVDKNNPSRPQDLQQAINIAIAHYAKRNENFAKNISFEMKHKILEEANLYPLKNMVKRNMLSKFALLGAGVGAAIFATCKVLAKNKTQKNENKDVGSINKNDETSSFATEQSKIYVAMDDFLKQIEKK